MKYAYVVFCIVGLLSGCQKQFHYQGKEIKSEQLQQITIGQSTGADVLAILGSPTYVDDLQGIRWIYFYKKTYDRCFLALFMVTQKVVEITFKANTVSHIAEKITDDSQTVEISSDKTSVYGDEDSAIKKLLSNYGRVAKKER